MEGGHLALLCTAKCRTSIKKEPRKKFRGFFLCLSPLLCLLMRGTKFPEGAGGELRSNQGHISAFQKQKHPMFLEGGHLALLCTAKCRTSIKKKPRKKFRGSFFLKDKVALIPKVRNGAAKQPRELISVSSITTLQKQKHRMFLEGGHLALL